MTYWTRQTILQLYTNRYPYRGDSRVITDNESGTWMMWICYGNGHQHHFKSPHYMPTEQAVLTYALDLLREDARGNICLDYEAVDSDEDEDEGDDEDDDEDLEESDDDNLHDSDPEDPRDQGDYGPAHFSDDEEDFDERNNHGNPYDWEESDDSGFTNGTGQVGSYGYYR